MSAAHARRGLRRHTAGIYVTVDRRWRIENLRAATGDHALPDTWELYQQTPPTQPDALIDERATFTAGPFLTLRAATAAITH